LFDTLVKATVFLGGGRITSALIAGLRLANYNRPITVHDRHPEKLSKLKRQHGVEVEVDLGRAVQAARLLIIAVRPDSVSHLLKEIAAQPIQRETIAVSLAAGIPLGKLQSALKRPVLWARAMPSPVCRNGQGLTALAFGRGFSSARRKEVKRLFALAGEVVEIPERQFDAFTVTFSSSHGYHALATLTNAAEELGLDHTTARLAAAHALADGIAFWRTGNSPLHELLHEAVTPGGIAGAVIESLDSAGYEKMIARGLRAGIKRSRKNAVEFA
jgi:pyrroline-5-carboxylate reductase